jgi:hypothetical protein
MRKCCEVGLDEDTAGDLLGCANNALKVLDNAAPLDASGVAMRNAICELISSASSYDFKGEWQRDPDLLIEAARMSPPAALAPALTAAMERVSALLSSAPPPVATAGTLPETTPVPTTGTSEDTTLTHEQLGEHSRGMFAMAMLAFAHSVNSATVKTLIETTLDFGWLYCCTADGDRNEERDELNELSDEIIDTLVDGTFQSWTHETDVQWVLQHVDMSSLADTNTALARMWALLMPDATPLDFSRQAVEAVPRDLYGDGHDYIADCKRRLGEALESPSKKSRTDSDEDSEEDSDPDCEEDADGTGIGLDPLINAPGALSRTVASLLAPLEERCRSDRDAMGRDPRPTLQDFEDALTWGHHADCCETLHFRWDGVITLQDSPDKVPFERLLQLTGPAMTLRELLSRIAPEDALFCSHPDCNCLRGFSADLLWQHCTGCDTYQDEGHFTGKELKTWPRAPMHLGRYRCDLKEVATCTLCSP